MKSLCLIALLGVSAAAWGQDAAAPAPAAAGADEVIVPGRRPENLRVEIERLERVVYERWNELNKKDDLDIVCREMEPTGSNIPTRTCAPYFVIQAEARATQDAVRGRSRADSFKSDAEQIMGQKSRELTEEMQRVAREDEQFLRDLVRLDELKQLQASERPTRRAAR